MRLAPTFRCIGCVLGTAFLLGACSAEFPQGSPYNSPTGRAALDEQVNRDVGAMLLGMRMAQEGRYWSSRLRRGTE